MTRTAPTVEQIARDYVHADLLNVVASVGLRAALVDPPETHDPDLSEAEEEYGLLAGTPLRENLRIGDEMLTAMVAARGNIERKIAAQRDDNLAPEANARYEEQKRRASIALRRTTNGTFSAIASCQGGDEVDLIYRHPFHGVESKMPADEYRVRTSAYVAAFGVEVYPGDRAAGLVHPIVDGRLTAR